MCHTPAFFGYMMGIGLTIAAHAKPACSHGSAIRSLPLSPPGGLTLMRRVQSITACAQTRFDGPSG